MVMLSSSGKLVSISTSSAQLDPVPVVLGVEDALDKVLPLLEALIISVASFESTVYTQEAVLAKTA